MHLNQSRLVWLFCTALLFWSYLGVFFKNIKSRSNFGDCQGLSLFRCRTKVTLHELYMDLLAFLSFNLIDLRIWAASSYHITSHFLHRSNQNQCRYLCTYTLTHAQTNPWLIFVIFFIFGFMKMLIMFNCYKYSEILDL